MTIESAIKILSDAKTSGTKSIVFAFWEADLFNRPDDKAWEKLTDIIEDSMDWSHAHENMNKIIETELE
jgi:hypothetical protein